MEIVWSGHSCFTLRGKATTLVVDPCPPAASCITRWDRPQTVLVSHGHEGHSYTEEIPGEPHVFCGPGEYEVGGAFITGLGTFHDAEQGAVRGRNTVFVIELEGLRLCHLGDLGHSLSAPALREVGNVDILFVPVGNVTTLRVAEALSIVRSLQPRYVLPMHYRTETARPDLEPIETFLTAMAVQAPEPRPKLSVTTTSLPPSPQVVILACDGRAG